jgi:hypothetical protein
MDWTISSGFHDKHALDLCGLRGSMDWTISSGFHGLRSDIGAAIRLKSTLRLRHAHPGLLIVGF